MAFEDVGIEVLALAAAHRADEVGEVVAAAGERRDAFSVVVADDARANQHVAAFAMDTRIGPHAVPMLKS